MKNGMMTHYTYITAAVPANLPDSSTSSWIVTPGDRQQTVLESTPLQHSHLSLLPRFVI